MIKLTTSLLITFILFASPLTGPYDSLTQDERALIKPQVERWIRDQVKHDWVDLWEIQDQTSDLKNEILLGQREAPDMDRNHFVQAMRGTIGTGYPEIRAFTLHEIRKEENSYLILGCGKQQREEWKQTSLIEVRARIVKGKVLFGLYGGTPEPCKL